MPARLAALRAAHAGAGSANSAKRLGGVVTSGGYRRYWRYRHSHGKCEGGWRPDAAAFYLQAANAANAALVALVALNPDHERAEVPDALAAETRGALGPSIAPERHRKAMAGILRGFGAHSRPSGEGAPS
jgi:hypothetical protein